MLSSKEILAKLVSFDTTSRNSNLELTSWVKEYLQQHNVNYWTVPNVDGTKENVFATIGENVDGGVVLSGHTDVVPVDGQDWATDPFTLTEKNDRLYGRGSCDMKGFLACSLAAIPQMNKAGLNRPIHIAMSYDEEVGCVGAPFMIKEMAQNTPTISAVIVGEPTNMALVDMHKGAMSGSVTFKGVDAHSSIPQFGVSATDYAVRFMAKLLELNEYFSKNPQPGLLLEPPYSTINIASINGGGAGNIVPAHCDVGFLIRLVPQDTKEDVKQRLENIMEPLLEQMKSENASCNITLTVGNSVPSLKPEPDDANAISLARRLTGQNSSGPVGYGTEGGQFQEGGFSTIVCGPGSIEQAHKPDEFIELEEIAKCDRFLKGLIGELST